MTAPSDGWPIDCGHWHCPDRHDSRHGHPVAPSACPECEDEPTPSERARDLSGRALRIAERIAAQKTTKTSKEQ